MKTAIESFLLEFSIQWLEKIGPLKSDLISSFPLKKEVFVDVVYWQEPGQKNSIVVMCFAFLWPFIMTVCDPVHIWPAVLKKEPIFITKSNVLIWHQKYFTGT